MSLSDVIVISDGSDNEDLSDAGNVSDDSDVVVLSVSSPPPLEPSSNQPRLWSKASEMWDCNDAEDDQHDSDLEFIDAAGLISTSQRRNTSSQSSVVTPGSVSQYGDNASTIQESRKRKNPAYSYRDDSDGSPVVDAPKTLPQRSKNTDREKALEKAETETQRLAKQEAARRRKEAAVAEKATQELERKARKDANKLVSDKKTTLKDMALELSPTLISSSLYAPLRAKMREFDCPVKAIADSIVTNFMADRSTDLITPYIKIIRWKRCITATYDERARAWVPLPEADQYTRTEATYLIYVTGQDVVRSFSRDLCGAVWPISQQVGALRAALGPKHHIHLMLCGWKKARKTQEIKASVERELVRLQVREGLYVEQVPDEEQAVNWIYNMSADLGIKPHKLIERSHLPFCAQATSAFKVGNSDADTMAKMLAQLPRLTDLAAKAVVNEYGTINRLMEAYERAEEQGGGAIMLANVVIPQAKSGKDAPRVLNKALSSRLHGALWHQDAKALVN